MASKADAPKPGTLGWYLRFGLAGGICASFNHLILVPVDVIKTQMQLSSKPVGFGETYRGIVGASGMRGLALGLTPTVVGYFVQGAGKFGLFEVFKSMVPAETSAASPFLTYLACASVAETFATTALTPWEALRIRAVCDPRGYGALSVPAGMRRILATEGGFPGLYRGLLPLLGKQVPYTMVQLAVFTTGIDWVYGRLVPRLWGAGTTKADLSPSTQLAFTVATGAVAGAVSSLASQPGDTILTRVNASVKKQAGGAGVPPAVPTMGSVLKELGFKGLWLGTGTRAVMTAVLSAGMFLVNDSVKLAVGLPSSGKAAAAASGAASGAPAAGAAAAR